MKCFPCRPAPNYLNLVEREALPLRADLSRGEYAKRGKRSICCFGLQQAGCHVGRDRVLIASWKLYCCLKNYQTLTDCAGYNWAARSESWGEDLQAAGSVRRSQANIGGAKHIRPLTLKHLIRSVLSARRSGKSLLVCGSAGRRLFWLISKRFRVVLNWPVEKKNMLSNDGRKHLKTVNSEQCSLQLRGSLVSLRLEGTNFPHLCSVKASLSVIPSYKIANTFAIAFQRWLSWATVTGSGGQNDLKNTQNNN